MGHRAHTQSAGLEHIFMALLGGLTSPQRFTPQRPHSRPPYHKKKPSPKTQWLTSRDASLTLLFVYLRVCIFTSLSTEHMALWHRPQKVTQVKEFMPAWEWFWVHVGNLGWGMNTWMCWYTSAVCESQKLPDMISQTPVPAQYWLSHAHVIVKLNFKHIKSIKLVLLRSDPTSSD